MTDLPVALIPAYKPSNVLPSIAKELVSSGAFKDIYCVDDGSGLAYANIFDTLTGIGVKVLRHAVNMGKGMALRTGMNVILAQYPNTAGVVTLDADGQHLSNDAVNIAKNLFNNNGKLILGRRTFDDQQIPLRSRFGNLITKYVFTIVSGMKISDTQTGLRGIPASLIPSLLKLKTTGYDFELDMLVCAKDERIGFIEIPITTVYENGNSSSSFNPLVDSFRIYFVFLRYLWVGLLSFFIDFTIFMVLFHFFKLPVTGVNIFARAISSTCNFLLNRHFVFKSKGDIKKEYIKYFILMVYVITINTSIVYFTYNYVTKFPAVVKLTAELLTFFVTFIISRNFVFKEKIRR